MMKMWRNALTISQIAIGEWCDERKSAREYECSVLARIQHNDFCSYLKNQRIFAIDHRKWFVDSETSLDQTIPNQNKSQTPHTRPYF